MAGPATSKKRQRRGESAYREKCNMEATAPGNYHSGSVSDGVDSAIPHYQVKREISHLKSSIHAVATSSGIRAIVHLPRFLGVDSVVSPKVADAQNLEVTMVVVWGRKESAAPAVEFAENRNLPIVYIEDGWIRTASEDAHSRRMYSLLVDHDGVYYDSSQPSELENLLNLPDAEFATHCGSAELEEAQHCRELLVANSITKYNFCKRAADSDVKKDERDLVLVIDQTKDDASLEYGDMTANRFKEMLTSAQSENPGARIVVRSHPDVVSGRRAGYLAALAESQQIEVSAHGDNPMDWLKQAAKVYVGTSQIGYEALLCGAEVHVFGKPFYAGWGLTKDRQSIPRRVQDRSIDQLFFAAHIAIAQYCHPVSGDDWTLRECIEHVCLQQREFARNAHAFVGDGITMWKRRYLRQFLRSPEGSIRFANAHSAGDDETALTWSFRDQSAGSSPSSSAVHRVEDGFLRSCGLGSDFVAPASIVVDSAGLYFDPSTPSDLENLLEQRDCTPDDIYRAVRLRRQILSAGVTKYNVDANTRKIEVPANRRFLLVVGQVADDESIKRGSVDVCGNLALCEAVKIENPDAYIVFKPHPDVVSGNRLGAIPDEILVNLVDAVITDISIIDCIEQCDEVHTITSLSGFEALLRNKPVVTYGLPFYAGWGLTQDRHNLARRTRVRTLDELVYLTLIVYPKYLDINSGEFIQPEELVSMISEESRSATHSGVSSAPTRRLWRKAQNIVKAMRYHVA